MTSSIKVKHRKTCLAILVIHTGAVTDMSPSPMVTDPSAGHFFVGGGAELIGLQWQDHLNGRAATLKILNSERGRWELEKHVGRA